MPSSAEVANRRLSPITESGTLRLHTPRSPPRPSHVPLAPKLTSPCATRPSASSHSSPVPIPRHVAKHVSSSANPTSRVPAGARPARVVPNSPLRQSTTLPPCPVNQPKSSPSSYRTETTPPTAYRTSRNKPRARTTAGSALQRDYPEPAGVTPRSSSARSSTPADDNSGIMLSSSVGSTKSFMSEPPCRIVPSRPYVTSPSPIPSTSPPGTGRGGDHPLARPKSCTRDSPGASRRSASPEDTKDARPRATSALGHASLSPRSGSFSLVRGNSLIHTPKNSSPIHRRGLSAEPPRPRVQSDHGRHHSTPPTAGSTSPLLGRGIRHILTSVVDDDFSLDDGLRTSVPQRRRSGGIASFISRFGQDSTRRRNGKSPTPSPLSAITALPDDDRADDELAAPIRTAIRQSGTFGVPDDGSDNESARFYHDRHRRRRTSCGSIVEISVRSLLYVENADAVEPSDDEDERLPKDEPKPVGALDLLGVVPTLAFDEAKSHPAERMNSTSTTNSTSSPPALSRSSSQATPTTESLDTVASTTTTSPCSTSLQHLNASDPHPLLAAAGQVLNAHATTLLQHADSMDHARASLRALANESLEWGSRLLAAAQIMDSYAQPDSQESNAVVKRTPSQTSAARRPSAPAALGHQPTDEPLEGPTPAMVESMTPRLSIDLGAPLSQTTPTPSSFSFPSVTRASLLAEAERLAGEGWTSIHAAERTWSQFNGAATSVQGRSRDSDGSTATPMRSRQSCSSTDTCVRPLSLMHATFGTQPAEPPSTPSYDSHASHDSHASSYSLITRESSDASCLVTPPEHLTQQAPKTVPRRPSFSTMLEAGIELMAAATADIPTENWEDEGTEELVDHGDDTPPIEEVVTPGVQSRAIVPSVHVEAATSPRGTETDSRAYVRSRPPPPPPPSPASPPKPTPHCGDGMYLSPRPAPTPIPIPTGRAPPPPPSYPPKTAEIGRSSSLRAATGAVSRSLSFKRQSARDARATRASQRPSPQSDASAGPAPKRGWFARFRGD